MTFDELAVLALPHRTQLHLHRNDSTDRLFILCPDVHFLEPVEQHVREFHAIMLDELIALVEQAEVDCIVREGATAPLREQAEDLRQLGHDFRSIEARHARGEIPDEIVEISWATLTDAPVQARKDRLVAKLAGRWNTPDVLEAIFCGDIPCCQAEPADLHTERTALIVTLDAISAAFNANESLQAIVQAHLSDKLDSRRFSGKPGAEFLTWIQQKPAVADGVRHRRFAASYGQFRTTMLELEADSMRMNHAVAHDEIVRKLLALSTRRTLLTIGAHHVRDLVIRLSQHGNVLHVDLLQHLPADRRPEEFPPANRWDSVLPLPFVT